VIGALLAAALAAGCQDTPASDAARARLVEQLHREAIVIDGHSDTTTRFLDPDWRFDQRHERGHMDLPRIREGGLDAQFWSIYMGKLEGDGRSIREAVDRIDAVRRQIEAYPDQLELAGTAQEIRRAVARGKVASVMGVEGGHIIENRLSALRTFYRLGVRYMTLTHSFNTDWADSSGIREPFPPATHGGLSAFGERVVCEMNRLGMLVDVSHVSDDTFEDAVRVSRAPVIASHSSTRAVANHARNMTDDMLRELARSGGVVMINFYPGYNDEGVARASAAHRQLLAPRFADIRQRFENDTRGRSEAFAELFRANPWPTAPLDVLLDHFDHAIRVAGPDHVGLGADWDGVASMPEGLEDVSRLPALTAGLVERGHSRKTIEKVLGGNVLRAMAANERIARELQRKGEACPGPEAPA
jgi:membrane dipeptidase